MPRTVTSSLHTMFLALGIAGAVTGAAAAQTAKVNCAKHQTITAALAANSPANGPLTLLVNGTCNEDVFVDRFSGVTIEGNPAATIRPAHATDVTLNAASQLVLRNIEIVAGSIGIYVGPHSYLQLQHSTVTGTGAGVDVWDNSSLDVTDSTISATGAYGIQSALGSTIQIVADAGNTTEITGAHQGVSCGYSTIDLSTSGNGTILIDKNREIGVQDYVCNLQTYNPSGAIRIAANGQAGNYGAGLAQASGVAILNSVEIVKSAGDGAIDAVLNAAVQLNGVTLTGNVAGISAGQGAVVQFTAINGISTVSDNGNKVFSCYQGGHIYVDQIAGTIKPPPTKAQLGCLHIGGP
jgi:Right handed beta helix region